MKKKKEHQMCLTLKRRVTNRLNICLVQVFRIGGSDYFVCIQNKRQPSTFLAFLALKREVPVGFAIDVICPVCYRVLISL
jgi:hypothetical protein